MIIDVIKLVNKIINYCVLTKFKETPLKQLLNSSREHEIWVGEGLDKCTKSIYSLSPYWNINVEIIICNNEKTCSGINEKIFIRNEENYEIFQNNWENDHTPG